MANVSPMANSTSTSNLCPCDGAPCVDVRSMENWIHIEDRLRDRWFRLLHAKAYASEFDLALRLFKALDASRRPIRNPEALQLWYCRYVCRPRKARATTNSPLAKAG